MIDHFVLCDSTEFYGFRYLYQQLRKARCGHRGKTWDEIAKMYLLSPEPYTKYILVVYLQILCGIFRKYAQN